MSKKPLIGITLDWEAPKPGGFSETRPYYALRTNYVQSVAGAGGDVVLIPYETASIARYVDLCDGFMIPGGAADVDPKIYGDTDLHPSVKMKPLRSDFELSLIRAILQTRKPILGICNGMQVLNVAMGGSLIQHIPDMVPRALEHSTKPPFDVPAHDIIVKPGTKLFAIVGQENLSVNSSHHQGIRNPAPGLIATAHANDGIIEALESPNHPFCVAVQWHPEYYSSPADAGIFNAFIKACS